MRIVPVPVPAVVVNPVGAALLNAPVPAVVTTRVPPLKVKSFVPVWVNTEVVVAVCPFRSNVPSTRFKLPVPVMLRASSS